ncbi:MAG: hypothetical protein ACOCUL_04615, partial [Bacteroidota bacterium]
MPWKKFDLLLQDFIKESKEEINHELNEFELLFLEKIGRVILAKNLEKIIFSQIQGKNDPIEKTFDKDLKSIKIGDIQGHLDMLTTHSEKLFEPISSIHKTLSINNFEPISFLTSITLGNKAKSSSYLNKLIASLGDYTNNVQLPFIKGQFLVDDNIQENSYSSILTFSLSKKENRSTVDTNNQLIYLIGNPIFLEGNDETEISISEKILLEVIEKLEFQKIKFSAYHPGKGFAETIYEIHESNNKGINIHLPFKEMSFSNYLKQSYLGCLIICLPNEEKNKLEDVIKIMGIPYQEIGELENENHIKISYNKDNLTIPRKILNYDRKNLFLATSSQSSNKGKKNSFSIDGIKEPDQIRDIATRILQLPLSNSRDAYYEQLDKSARNRNFTLNVFRYHLQLPVLL